MGVPFALVGVTMVLRRRRELRERPPTRRNWTAAILAAWGLAIAAVVILIRSGLPDGIPV